MNSPPMRRNGNGMMTGRANMPEGWRLVRLGDVANVVLMLEQSPPGNNEGVEWWLNTVDGLPSHSTETLNSAESRKSPKMGWSSS